MRQPARRVWGTVAVGAVCAALAATACGGANKPPMVPDAPDPALSDGGPELPPPPPKK